MKTRFSDTPWVENAAGEWTPVLGDCFFGGASTNTVVLPDANVSRSHALIHHLNAEYWLVDLGNSEGTFVNGCRVSQALRLHDNDRIQIGVHCFVFREAGRDVGLTFTADHQSIMGNFQRIQCWLMLADIENSTQLLRSLPIEDAVSIIGRWIDDSKQIVDDQLGTINKFLGDGFFAYWREVVLAGRSRA